MAVRFLIGIAIIVAVMAALVFAPGINNRQPGTPAEQVALSLEYGKQLLTRTQSGLVATNAEVLSIENDGAATFTRATGQQTAEMKFNLSAEDLARLKGLILETGFMQIPVTEYLQKEGDANFTKYTLQVRAGGNQKIISWVDPDSYGRTIPPIISNVGSKLDAIISKHT